MTDNARLPFVTGSQVYGTPHEKSDIDLVMLVDYPEMMTLLGLEPDADYGSCEFFSVRHGKLNILAVTKACWYDAWKIGTKELIARKPVTRDQAIEVFQARFKEVREMLALEKPPGETR